MPWSRGGICTRSPRSCQTTTRMSCTSATTTNFINISDRLIYLLLKVRMQIIRIHHIPTLLLSFCMTPITRTSTGKRGSLIADADLRRVIETRNLTLLVEAQHQQHRFYSRENLGVLFISREGLKECPCAHVRYVWSRWGRAGGSCKYAQQWMVI